MRVGVVVVAVLLVGLVAFVVAARRRRPETVWNPGLEFDPDFDLTPEEIEADRRGESPSA
ncbi:MAG: hypothetical protein FGM58_00710 [Acidimicrobiia bacterium]|nr:hypothetical protein [Acidimicrobiia bacterium]